MSNQASTSQTPAPILSPELAPVPDPGRAAITAGWILDEATHVREMLALAALPEREHAAAQAVAADLVRRVRARARDQGVIEAFMRQYDLGSEEGVLLMCVAEALLRIPDQATADALIRDKLGDANWKRHLGQSDSVLVNASTWGLLLTGKLVDLADDTKRDAHGAFQRLVGRAGEPVIRLAVRQAMKIMGHQFVLGRTIDEALARSRKGDNAASGAAPRAGAHRPLERCRPPRATSCAVDETWVAIDTAMPATAARMSPGTAMPSACATARHSATMSSIMAATPSPCTMRP